MKTTTAAKIISVLPKRFTKYISKTILNRFLNRHMSLYLSGEEILEDAQLPTIFICNHLSNADGLILNNVLEKVDPTFVAGAKLASDDVTNIGMNVVKTTTIIPNTPDKEGIKRIIDLIKSGESVLIFPEGTRSRAGSMIEAKKGIILIARMTKVPIIPIGIHGSERLLPIDTEGNMGDENFNDADVHITIGKQFEVPKRNKDQSKKAYEESVLQHLMGKIAELLPEDYRGVYK